MKSSKLFEIAPKKTWSQRLGKISFDKHLQYQEQNREFKLDLDKKTVFIVPGRTGSDRIELTFKEVYNLKKILTSGGTIESLQLGERTVKNPNLN